MKFVLCFLIELSVFINRRNEQVLTKLVFTIVSFILFYSPNSFWDAPSILLLLIFIELVNLVGNLLFSYPQIHHAAFKKSGL